MSSFVESDEFELLLDRIRANDESLKVVDLDAKNVGDDGCRRLAEGLRGNTVVFTLNVGWASIGPAGTRALAEMLRSNNTITHLGLGGNNINDDGATALAEVLRSHNTVTHLNVAGNSINDDGALALADMLQVNTSLTYIYLNHNSIGGNLRSKLYCLVDINKRAPNPQEAHRLKVECRIGWMLDSEEDEDDRAAVSLALDELESFPRADRRRGLIEKLLGSTEHGADVSASVDAAQAKVLFRYAADCGASPVVLMNLLRAHPLLCTCRDVKHQLYPFMLLATMNEAGPGDVMEALLLNPFLVQGGLAVQD